MADTSDGSMSFWDHLDALRTVIFRIAAVIVVLGIGFFCVMPWLFDHVILAPCRADFPLYRMFDFISIPELSDNADFKVDLINVQLASQFFIHMSASCWAALVCGFPLIIYQLWGFIEPGLYEREKRASRKAFFMGCLMFYAGLLTGYFLVFPLALRFLADYHLSESIANTVTIDSYMDNFYMIVLSMGLVFELPLLAWLLGRMGLITRGFFRKYRRHAIVALLILAGIITPTGDPFTLFAVFIPLYALWEFGASLVPKKAVDDEG